MPGRFLTAVTLTIGLTAFAASTAFAQTGPLLQPGEPFPGTTAEPIHLHLPVHKAPPASNPSPPATNDVATENTSAPQIDLIHPPRHKHTTPPQLANTVPATSAPETIPFSLDGSNQALSPPPTDKTQPAPGKAAARPTSATRTTRQASETASGDRANLARRGKILFEKGASSPSPAQYRGVKVLADNLNNALEKGAAAIQLEAYGGAPGDKSSDARRLSLRRALAVRQLLIDDGVPSARIDVRAMGGSNDGDSPDRVDVFIRTG
jgi:outer membrane protein OmpA-like peptidoglycan-associated protein